MNTQRVVISIADPWDLGEALSWRPLHGDLLTVELGEHGGRGLVRLDARVEYNGSVWLYVVASPRHKGSTIDAVQQGRSVICVFTGISETQASSPNSLDTSWWRGGGLAFIGNLEPLEQARHDQAESN